MTAWGVWAAEAASSTDRWAYLFKLANRRAELTLDMLAEAVEQVNRQQGMIAALEGELAAKSRELTEVEEQLETALVDLEDREERLAS